MKSTTVVILLLALSITGLGQIREIPIKRTQNNSLAQLPGARIESTTPITLPIWDDFSTSNGVLDTAYWMPGSQVQVLPRPGNGILPPTLNVVTFDGVDAQGIPYSSADTDGPVDSLLSRYIDLTAVPVNLRSSVYLSFFFQVKGNGNQPEPQDSLILYFRKADSVWQKMWPLANDIIPQDPTIFTEKLINVPNNADFFHEEFQFMFRANGRQNGWFDNWNIDYVYMDKRRNGSDNSYLDRALTDYPTSILGQYTAMPFNEFVFNSDPGQHLNPSSTWIRTLENDTQPIQYSANIYDTLNDILLEQIANDVELIMFPKDLKEATSSVPNSMIFDQTADSLFLEVEYFVSTGDKFLIDSIYNAEADTAFYKHINLRVNDTVRSYITINDYFAYDDGSAEYGAGINQQSGRIAYEYITKTGQYIDHLDIYFPNISRNQEGTPIDIFILDDLTDVLSTPLAISSVSIQHEGINKFSSYYFSKSIYVQDTFYIGFTNKANDNLWTAVGLDKNTNTASKIYYTIGSSWVKNTDIDGSLMMRPYFTDRLVSGIEDFDLNIEVFPNPSNGQFTIRGRYNKLIITDILGRSINYSVSSESGVSRIQLSEPPGLVMITIATNEGKTVRKLVIQD